MYLYIKNEAGHLPDIIPKKSKNGSRTKFKLKLQKENLEENTEVNLCNTGLGNGFLGMTPKAQAAKEKDINDIILN